MLDTDVKHRVIGFAEKPKLPRPMSGRPGHSRISMGVYVFKRDVLVDVLQDVCRKGRGSDFGHDIIPALVKSSRGPWYDFRGYWRDIGSIDKLLPIEHGTPRSRSRNSIPTVTTSSGVPHRPIFTPWSMSTCWKNCYAHTHLQILR